MNKLNTEQFDICIAGGGLVGMLLAVALAPLSLKVCLVDEKPWRETKDIDFSKGKAIALNYASYQLLVDLNIWPQLASNATPIKTVHVSEKGRFGSTKMTAKSLALPALGYLVPEPFLNQALEKAVQALKNSVLYKPAKMLGCQQKDTRHQLEIEMDYKKKTIDCGLLIAADGSNSMLREIYGFETHDEAYDQMALVTKVSTSAPHHSTAYERFTEVGTLALLPLQGQCSALVITASQEKINHWRELSEKVLLVTLQEYFGDRLGQFLSADKCQIFPLEKKIAKKQAARGLVLLGNAAHAIHPIAAQGLNLSFQDISVLVQLLKMGQQSETDIDYFTLSEKYDIMRQEDQRRTIFLTDSIFRVFTHSSAAVSRYRHLGLVGLTYLPKLKKRLAKVATGL